jgi:hypothetical protein
MRRRHFGLRSVNVHFTHEFDPDTWIPLGDVAGAVVKAPVPVGDDSIANFHKRDGRLMTLGLRPETSFSFVIEVIAVGKLAERMTRKHEKAAALVVTTKAAK